MGITGTRKNFNFHVGELVSSRDLYNNEKGSPIPDGRKCIDCWYKGERLIFKKTNGKKEFYLLHMGRVIFFNKFDQVSTEDLKAGTVCLAGLKGFEQAKKITLISTPERVRCFQQRITKL